MISDIIIIGAGASGLMAAYGSAEMGAKVIVLEKMPRPGRKIMITGKGRCNVTNLKEWNEFSAHIRTNPNFLKPAFYNFTPQAMINFLKANGLDTIVERGDRVYPSTYYAGDVVDTLVNACYSKGVEIVTNFEVDDIVYDSESDIYIVKDSEGHERRSKKNHPCYRWIVLSSNRVYRRWIVNGLSHSITI